MRNLKFSKEPGYIYDLLFLFTYKFYKDYCLTNFINYNKSAEDTAYFNNVLSDFEPIPDDLLPFFYIMENGECFITKFYYVPYKEDFTTTYNLAKVQTAITDYDQVISNLIRFYFMDIDSKSLSECKSSLVSIGRLIKESKYNDTVKSSLFAFFIDPVPTIQKLAYELMSKEFQLSQQYEKNYQKISEVQNQIDIEDLSKKLKCCKNTQVNLYGFDDIYISICIFNKNCIRSFYYDDKAVLLLGIDYGDTLEFILTQNRLPELDEFGNAIAEKNRVEILEFMFCKGEITIKDVEQELCFTGTNAYYHLSLMLRANLIKTRNQGRTVLYSVNNQYFDVVCDMLSKYSNKKGEKLS